MTLKELIDSEPANAAKTDADVLVWLRESVQRNRESLSGDEAFSATDGTEWAGLSAAHKNHWLAFCGRDTIDPAGAANVAFVTSLFGGGSATVANLVAIRSESVTRWRTGSLGFEPNLGDVEQARSAP